MRPIFVLLPILLPLICGALIPFLKFEKARSRELYVAASVVLNAALVLCLLLNRPQTALTVLRLTPQISIAFAVDGLSMVFAGLLAVLWPLASLYAFAYMKHEGKENSFFSYYTMAFGVALGIAFAANMITMYLFYELLTLVTLPLIMHAMTPEAIHAGRKYIIYSIAGAASALMGTVILLNVAGTADFAFGGVLQGVKIAKPDLAMLGYLLMFMGFGVKAAVFPLHAWLPTAGVAPTPVTALLHAVAVVKAGVFAIMRATYYSFGTAFLKGTFAQYIALTLAIITIVFGSVMAVRERHLKRRLAYSTVSNLSYIVFGAALMSSAGMAAAMTHMVFHGVMKICLFFCAGAVICESGREYVTELGGLGKRMPVTFFSFTVASLALVGVPGLCGFVSKLQLAMAATQENGVLPLVGIFALIVSAILTAVYLLTIVINAYFPRGDLDDKALERAHDPHWYMKAPMLVLGIMTIVLGLFSQPMLTFLESVASGLI